MRLVQAGVSVVRPLSSGARSRQATASGRAGGGGFALHGLLELGILLGGVGAVRAFCVSSQSAGRHPCFDCRGLPWLGDVVPLRVFELGSTDPGDARQPPIEPAAGAAILDRLIPVTATLFTPFNFGYAAVISLVGLLTVIALHPREGAVTLSREQVDAILPKPPTVESSALTPAARLDRFPGWVVLAVILIAYPLGHSMVTRGFGTSWTINAYNMTFLVAALLLHRRPNSFVHACREGVGTSWGIILQFPFYAGIFGIMNSTGLGAWLGERFAEFATTGSYPLVVYIYSAFMNLFVPSAGSKWLIEAPYLIPAGRELGVSVETVVMAYAYGDATTNLIQPFWAIPLLAVARLRFGEMVGYTSLIAAACFAVSVVAMLLIPPAL